MAALTLNEILAGIPLLTDDELRELFLIVAQSLSSSPEKRPMSEFYGILEGPKEDAQERVNRLRREWDSR